MSINQVGLAPVASFLLTRTAGTTQSVASQTFATGATRPGTAPAFDSWGYDPHNEGAYPASTVAQTPHFRWDPASANTISTRARGWYYATAGVEFSASTVGHRTLWIDHAAGRTVSTVSAYTTATAQPLALTVTTPAIYVQDQPFDFIMWVAQNSGSALNINIDATYATTYMQLVYLGDW